MEQLRVSSAVRVLVHKSGKHPYYEGPYKGRYLKFAESGAVTWVSGAPKGAESSYVSR